MQHSNDCRRRKRALIRFEDKWPNYCRECGASGVIEWWEDVGEPRRSRMHQIDYCEKCLGRCPRCGKEIAPHDNSSADQYNDWQEKQNPCPHCRWNWGRNEGDLTPDAECSCWRKK